MKKPEGKWICRACQTICDGDKLYKNPLSSRPHWTCSDVYCGGTCDPLPEELKLPTEPAESIPA
jgi:hypothetical protein